MTNRIFNDGDRVALSAAHVKALGYDHEIAAMRGTVKYTVKTGGPSIIKVLWDGEEEVKGILPQYLVRVKNGMPIDPTY